MQKTGELRGRKIHVTVACKHCSGIFICCGSILSLVQIFFSFVSNSLSCYYHTLPYPITKENKI